MAIHRPGDGLVASGPLRFRCARNAKFLSRPPTTAKYHFAAMAYIDRAMSIFMISFEPPKMRVTRLSRNIFAIGYSLM